MGWRQIDYIMMEEYQNRANYLRHLKKIANTRQLSRKNNPLSDIFSNAQNNNKHLVASSKCSRHKDRPQPRGHTSTQRIMRDFTTEKENSRLLSKIIGMNSSIPFRQYQQQYQHSKHYPLKEHCKLKRNNKYITFKIFDINMNHGQESCPDDHFSIFIVQNRKRVLVAKQSLYELRKMEFKVKRGQESMIRVEGQEHGGSVRFDQSNLMDIIRHGHKIGHIVVEYLKK